MYLTASNFPVEAVRSQIGEAIDVIVHLSRMPDKSRKVVEIVEVEGFKDGRYVVNPIFRFDRDRGLEATGNSMKNTDKANRRGIKL